MNSDDPFKELAADEDEFDVVHEAVIAGGELVRYDAARLSSDVRYREKEREDKRTGEPDHEPVDHQDPRSKIHPLLMEWLGKRDLGGTQALVVTFRDELAMPRFPEPDVDQPRDCCDNERELERADALAEAVRRERARDYERLSEPLRRVEAKVTDTFWLIRGMQVHMPLANVEQLAEDEEVLYIEPDNTNDPPPQNDVVDGRRDIVSDPYFDLGLTAGWIGLLDTGVRRSHVVFNSPSHIDFMRDCVNGGADCNTGTAQPQRRLLEPRHFQRRHHHSQRPAGRRLPRRHWHHARQLEGLSELDRRQRELQRLPQCHGLRPGVRECSAGARPGDRRRDARIG